MVSEEDIKCIEDNIKQSKRLFKEVGVYAYFDKENMTTVEKLIQEYRELKEYYKEQNEVNAKFIPKSLAEEKIEEIDEEYNKVNTSDNNEWYIDSEKFAYAKEKIGELLKGDK